MAKVKTGTALRQAFRDKQVLVMLILGLASGLPYAAVGGTLNAWLTTAGVKPVAIGLLSWALLAYAFKFMWSAALQSHRTPLGLNFGPRRFWMFVFIVLISAGLFVLALSEPASNLAFIGIVSILIAVASASLDIVVAAWRIEIARDDQHLDILSSVEQFGYRIASWVAGFVALIVADHIGWRLTFVGLSAVMALCLGGVLLAARSPLADKTDKTATLIRQGGHLSSQQRYIGTWLTLAGWALGFYLIGDFMFGALTDPENHKASTFIRNQGPFVIVSTVIWLGVISAVLVWMNGRENSGVAVQAQANPGITDVLYRAILEPMMELISRLRWVAILVLLVVVSYRFTDLIWGGFAYPFYLGENYGALGHTLTEVGFASKLMGVIATIIGIALGGLAMIKFGRMPVFFVGAVLAAATNLLFADLALDARFTDAVLGFLQIDNLFSIFGLDLRMARLTSVIFAENLAVGLASAASVAYLSSIVNKDYAAVQYALLVSLIMLLGVLGRPTIGEIIETQGFAKAFIICAALGGVAAILALIEWIRLSRATKKTAD